MEPFLNFFICCDWVSIYNPNWPGIHTDLPASASYSAFWMVGLQAYDTTPGWRPFSNQTVIIKIPFVCSSPPSRRGGFSQDNAEPKRACCSVLLGTCRSGQTWCDWLQRHFLQKTLPRWKCNFLPTIHWLWFSVTVCNIWLSSSVSPSEMEYFSCLPAKGILLTLDKRLGNSEHCCLSRSAVTHMLVTETGAVRETGSPDFLVSMWICFTGCCKTVVMTVWMLHFQCECLRCFHLRIHTCLFYKILAMWCQWLNKFCTTWFTMVSGANLWRWALLWRHALSCVLLKDGTALNNTLWSSEQKLCVCVFWESDAATEF